MALRVAHALLSPAAMTRPPRIPAIPFGWSALIVGVFTVFVFFNLATPSRLYFDEIHYIPAARMLLEFDHISNREHPLVGKELLALGDHDLRRQSARLARCFRRWPGSARCTPSCAACGTRRVPRFATLAGGVLLATGFVLFVQSRIAMLDIFMVCFCMVGLWMVRGRGAPSGQARGWSLAGIALALASRGSKWNAAPIVAAAGLSPSWSCGSTRAGTRFLTRKDCAPIPGIGPGRGGRVARAWLPILVYLADVSGRCSFTPRTR